ncbi:uncharacterized protein LOC121878317 [Homarus americanus]|uniref:Tigger transposable element-derived protein 4-like 7 n=1 Tax=Homarus americanus TaxID=6706 RepID=A0A8J5JNA6_HOMAM|nr:uncharacterized protein LOC121878317 [Homarus americanus]XP_042240366.1 uncharacterized protein LOC121878317 [Homarus americanus]KAG7158680.1 Tigger transposable element-derived protein 4-like 7 [Homarus americanus]
MELDKEDDAASQNVEEQEENGNAHDGITEDGTIVLNLSDECSIEEEVRLFMQSQKKVEPKRRAEITWKRKVEILKEIEKLPGKISHREMAVHFGIPRNTLFNILRARDRIIEAYKRNPNGRRKRLRSGKAPHVEHALYQWYKTAKKQKLALSNIVLFEKARDLAVSQGSYSFRPTTGWLERWKKRHNITFSVEGTGEGDNENGCGDVEESDSEKAIDTSDIKDEDDDHEMEDDQGSELDDDDDDTASPTAQDIGSLLQISLQETDDFVRRSGKGIKRRTLTLRQKFEIVKAVESLPMKWSLRDMASFFEVPKTTMLHMMKNRDLIIKNYVNSPDKERRRNKKGKAPDIEDALYVWYLKVKEKNLPITAGILRKKAKAIALSLGKPEFVPTEGWFARWKKRNNVTCGRPKQYDGTETQKVHPSEYDDGDMQLFHTAYEKETRTSLSLRQKVEIIHQMEAEPNVKLREWVDMYNVSKSTLSIIKKNKETILKAFYGDPSADRKRMRKGSASEVEEALFKWYNEVKDQNVPLTGPILRQKAKELADIMGKVDFIPTSTWLDTWKRKHGLSENKEVQQHTPTNLNQNSVQPSNENKQQNRFQFNTEHHNSGNHMGVMQNPPVVPNTMKPPGNPQTMNNAYPRDMFGFPVPPSTQEAVSNYDGFLRGPVNPSEAVVQAGTNVGPPGGGGGGGQQFSSVAAANKFLGSHIYGSDLSGGREMFAGNTMNRGVITSSRDHTVSAPTPSQGNYSSAERILQQYKMDNHQPNNFLPAPDVVTEGSVRRAMMEIRRYLEQSPYSVDWSVVHNFEMVLHTNIAARNHLPL